MAHLAVEGGECQAFPTEETRPVPTYQYVCTACEQPLEAQQSFTDDALTECPVCAGRLRKVFSAVGVVFKGSGFYRNDSRSTVNGSGSNGDGSGEGSGGEKTGDKTGDKTAARPATGPATRPATRERHESDKTSGNTGDKAAGRPVPAASPAGPAPPARPRAAGPRAARPPE